MRLNRTIYFLMIFLELFIFGCSKCLNSEEISGVYQIGDGGYAPNPEIIDGKQYLELRKNNTFTVYEPITSEKEAISGTYEIKSCKTVENNTKTYKEAILQFKIENRKINAKCLNGRRIIFDHPEEFYGNKKQILKYSKGSAII